MDTAARAKIAQTGPRFIGPGQLYPIELAGQRFHLKQAFFYAADKILDQPYRLFGDQIDIQSSPGVLRAAIA